MNTGKFNEVLKEILNNKNTKTTLIVFVGIIALYAVYNWRVNEATKLVQVPYASKELNSRNEITSDTVAYIEVPKSLLTKAKNVKTNGYEVVGKFVNYGYTIPKYSLFYDDALLTTSAKPESEFANIPSGYTVFSLDVDFDSTYGNSIYPGNYIDLYVKISDRSSSSDKIIFGRLIKGIKVMAVYDAEGNDVFESSSESRKPKYMWFAVPEDLYQLLMKATSDNVNADIMPIPRNSSYSAEERTPEIDSTYIQNYILAKSYNF